MEWIQERENLNNSMHILQITLNNFKKAQDLMIQYMRENKIALVSESNIIPGGNWLGEAHGKAAIHWGLMSPAPWWDAGEGTW